MMSSILKVDVSHLPAPEPLSKILEALSSSSEGDIICMIHRQRPNQLFPILQSRGFSYRLVESEIRSELKFYIYIYIWNSKNVEAISRVNSEIQNVY